MPGWKFSEWELRGVPLRLEIGPKDIEKSSVRIARRDTREKVDVSVDGIADHVRRLLDAEERGARGVAVAGLAQRRLHVRRREHAPIAVEERDHRSGVCRRAPRLGHDRMRRAV